MRIWQRGRLFGWARVPDRTVELWAMHHSRRLASLKIAAFIAFICEAFPSRTLMDSRRHERLASVVRTAYGVLK
jgi:hypothetical protein